MPCLSFNPRTPCGVRPLAARRVVSTEMFQSTHSLRSATNMFWLIGEAERVSIHALLAECDWSSWRSRTGGTGFNPRTPCGVRQDAFRPLATPEQFQSTHSLRSATGQALLYCPQALVSIHALLAECDAFRLRNRKSGAGFNPRTPCGVRRPNWKGVCITILFQSTHSLRSATIIKRFHVSPPWCFNPRTPCGVRLQKTRQGIWS